MGIEVQVVVQIDATAAEGMLQRRGLGKIRHIDVKELWLQEAVRHQRVKLEKIAGERNPADILTKHVDAREIQAKAWWVSVDLKHTLA